ncbi:MAG: type II toxin-antitoxin system Phd/YefM family antitoxin, partial [Terriglobales bacterium]
PQKPLTVNIFEAKTQLSKLVQRAEQGEEIILARAGKPVARLTRLQPEKRKIRFGGMKGKIWIAKDFDDPLPEEVLAEFEADL